MWNQTTKQARVNAETCCPGESMEEAEREFSSERVSTLRAYALAAVAFQTYGGQAPPPDGPEARFLLEQLQQLGSRASIWAEDVRAYMRRPAAEDEALVSLGEELGLSPIELLTVALAAAVEDDVMIGRALAHLQAPLGGSRPTLALVASAFGRLADANDAVLVGVANGAAVRSGLLTLLGEGAPLPERPLAVPVHLCLSLQGFDGSWAGATIGLGDVPAVPLPPSIRTEAAQHAVVLEGAPQRVLVLRTGSLGEGKSVAALIARLLGRRALFIETENSTALSPWLALRALLPVFCFQLGPDERKTLPVLPLYHGPILVLCGQEGGVEAYGETAPSWWVPVPSREEREGLWRQSLHTPENSPLAGRLAREHRHSSGRIAHLGRLAAHRCQLGGRSEPMGEDMLAASWVSEHGSLESLAQPLGDPIPEEALVTPETLKKELFALLARCRSRDGLAEGLGASAKARYRTGVRALFVGPSGTGKTLAAGWLATQLRLPLYRVDLASVISKYIGETEKNLAQLLARAEQNQVVLLFDEADSLFGKRTEVQQANDRFANTQTNYLLQRIESFDAIAILTSNSRNRFDDAFTRRLDAIVEFPIPGPEERRALWQAHLGTHHALAHQDLNRLAVVADLCGGHIRNVVLAAAVLARQEEHIIIYEDIFHGLISEYRKLGKQVPVELKPIT